MLYNLQAGFRTLNLGNSMPSNWDYMPEPIMHKIFAYIDLRAQQNCRLVSRYWNQLINSNLKVVLSVHELFCLLIL